MNKLILPAMISTLFITGCSMAPDYQDPTITMSDIYINQNTVGVTRLGAQDKLWWQQFNDPTLNQLVETAQNQNITLKIASQRIQAAQAYQQAVSSFKVPTISVGMAYTNNRLSENEAIFGDAVGDINLPSSIGGGTVKVVDRDTYDYIAGFTASWELDLFGRINSLSQAASIRAQQAKIMRNAVNTAITADVINNYLQYRGAQERIKIAQSNINDQNQTLKMVESLSRNGYGSKLDVANATAALSAVKASLPMLETAKTAHLARLAILLGENMGKTKARIGEGRLPQMKALIPTGLPSELLTRRPDIAIAQKEIAAKNQEVGAAIANRYPHIYLTGSPGLISDDFGDLFDSDSGAWTFGGGFTWTLFDGGRGDAAVKIQKAGFEEALLSYQNTVNAAFNEVETTLRAYGQTQKYHSNILEADYQAQKAVSKAKSLYKAGLVDHLSVLDAQRQRNQLQDAEVVARLGSATSVVLLQKALGGDWQIGENPPKNELKESSEQTPTNASNAEADTKQAQLTPQSLRKRNLIHS